MASKQDSGFRVAPIESSDLLADRVVETLRSAILEGELPPGARLSVPELARQLNVSRTPAREALIRLENLGLVHMMPRRGAVVLSGDASDIIEIFQYREALEGMAARLCTRAIDEETLGTLRAEFNAHIEAVEHGDPSEHIAHDQRFHSLIASASGNKRIASELERVHSQLEVLTRTGSTEPGAMGEAIIGAHREMLQAIESRDGRAAEQAARRHARGVLHFYEEIGMVPRQEAH